MSDKKTHFIFRVSKNPCDDATEYYTGSGWSFSEKDALLMTEAEASDNCGNYSTDTMIGGCGTFTDDHFLL